MKGLNILICGLGSIGRRHLRHFRNLGAARIDAFRTGLATLPDEGQPAPDRIFDDLEHALAEHPDVVVVANPTALHLPTALAAVRAGCHVLVEKPLSHNLDDCQTLADEAHARGVVVAVACNLRHHPSVRAVKGLVVGGQFGAILLARADFGTYLPDWHRWEDYRTSYAARRELGGGAALTHIHEIDCLLWLVGPARSAGGVALGRHPLGTDVDEACALTILHRSGAVSTATLSLAQKPATRSLDLRLTGGIITLDLTTGRYAARLANGPTWEGEPPPGFDFDHTYRDQAIAFASAVQGEDAPIVHLDEAVAALAVALSVKELPA